MRARVATVPRDRLRAVAVRTCAIISRNSPFVKSGPSPESVNETTKRFHEVCAEVEQQGTLAKMAANMRARFRAVIDAEGGPTKY